MRCSVPDGAGSDPADASFRLIDRLSEFVSMCFIAGEHGAPILVSGDRSS
jgi:hypothetical protein